MCTGIRLTAGNGDVVYARTMEFDTPLPECIGYFPPGQQFAGGTHSLGSDGINEKGLVAEEPQVLLPRVREPGDL